MVPDEFPDPFSSKNRYSTAEIGVLMDSRTQNIFFQPRYESDAQYEQNVVKHLITVLKRVDNSITGSLLTDILPEDWLPTDVEVSGYEYDIEVSPNDDPEYEKAYVLGLSNYQTELEEVEGNNKDSRADGQITAVTEDRNQSFSIIIEAKTGTDTLSSEQLNRYTEDFDADDFITAEWSAIYGTFNEPELTEEVNSFLVDEYAEFLLNEEMEGVVAESTHRDDEDMPTQVNQILIRYEPGLEKEPYALRFLSWYRDSADDDFGLNYSTWFSVADFEQLFSQIERDTRQQTFVGVENDEGDIEPSLDPLIEWAENGGYGPSDNQNDFKGSHREVVAEIEDRNGHFPELRLKEGEALRFSRLTENGSPNIQKPTHYEDHEFNRLLTQLNQDLREALFVDFEVIPVWDHYIRRSLNQN